MTLIKIIKSNSFVAFIIVFSCFEAHGEYKFEEGFFRAAGMADSNDGINLNIFNQGGDFLPGTYQMSVYINGSYLKQKKIPFYFSDKTKTLLPCFTEEDFDSLGIKLPWRNLDECFMPDKDKKIAWDIDMNSMRLDIIIPQAFVNHGQQFMTPWQSWDQGMNAVLINYDYNYNTAKKSGLREEKQYLGLENGLNVFGLRLRNQSVWSRNDKGDSDFDSLRTYVQKDYHYFQGGEFTAGKTYSEGGFFESIPFKGIMFSSSDQMLKSSFRNFTPEVRGVVQSSSAVVSVYRNGNILYQTTLPSGPFALKGIMNDGGGEYEIKIAESDGSVRSYTQSSESVPELLSEGRFKYNVLTGKSDFFKTNNINFSQLSLSYGVTDSYTIYGGSIYSSEYISAGLGNGFLLNHFGALSADFAFSKAKSENSSTDGQSLRASYYKELDATATSIGLFAYRYSSKSYLQFEEYLDVVNGYEVNNKKNKFEVVVRQNIGDAGYLTFSGRKQTYWGGHDSNTAVRVNHNVNIGKLSFNNYYEQEDLSDGRKNKLFGILMSYSIYENGKGFSLSNRFINENGNIGYQNSVNISPYENGNLNVAANSMVKEGQSNHYGIFTSYRGSLAESTLSYDKSDEFSRISTSVRGGGIIHANGLTMGRRISMDMPVAIVSTSGISGIKIKNDTKTVSDYFGNALITNLQPYQENNIALDVNSLSKHSDTIETDKRIIPSKGSVIPVSFEISKGERALFSVKYKGKYIPLGAVATISNKDSGDKSSFFADQGQLYLTGLKDQGFINVKWGKSMSSQCGFSYKLDSIKENYLHSKSVECR